MKDKKTEVLWWEFKCFRCDNIERVKVRFWRRTFKAAKEKLQRKGWSIERAPHHSWYVFCPYCIPDTMEMFAVQSPKKPSSKKPSAQRHQADLDE